MSELQLEIWNGTEYAPILGRSDDPAELRQRAAGHPSWRITDPAKGRKLRVPKLGRRRPRIAAGPGIDIEEQASRYALWLVSTRGRDVGTVHLWADPKPQAYRAERILLACLGDYGAITARLVRVDEDLNRTNEGRWELRQSA